MEKCRLRTGCQTVLLTLLLLPEFSTLCYLDDVVRLACTSRIALEPTVAFHLAFIRHMVTQHVIWHEDWRAERSAELDLRWFYEDEFPHLAGTSEDDMCLTCGIRPGAEWLGNDECYDCFAEH